MKRIAITLACIFLGAMARSPDGPFNPSASPIAPDYTNSKNWAAYPGQHGPAQRVPEGERTIHETARKADVFFIHPTTDYTGKSWNAGIHNARTNKITDHGTMAGQAAAFNKCCRIYAPRYRQMTLAGFISAPQTTAHLALDLAYQDVRNAFHAFLAATDDSRPIIIAGHSQGTNHLIRLLQDEVLGKPIMKQLVVVYAIGNRIPQAIMDGPLRSLPLCQSATQTQCLIAWDSFEADATPNRHAPHVGHWDGQTYRHYPAPLRTICTNPISWQQTGQRAEKENHKGAVRETMNLLSPANDGKSGKPLPAPLRQHVAAQCQQGQHINGLMIDKKRDRSLKLSRLLRKKGSLHILDYALFFIDIRNNADARVKAFLNNR